MADKNIEQYSDFTSKDNKKINVPEQSHRPSSPDKFVYPSDKSKSSKKLYFAPKLSNFLVELENMNDYIAFEMLYLQEYGASYTNKLGITRVDVSKNSLCFDVFYDGKIRAMKISTFIGIFFPNSFFKEKEINLFIERYQSLLSGQSPSGKAIEVTEFKYDPKNVRSTFLSLVTKTYPHGTEEEVLKYLPELEKDVVGNYYKIIGTGKPQTMFTSHLDTADRTQKVTKLYSKVDNKGNEFIVTDGNSILGSDDKSGVTVMLYMMAHNIPGLYYFFMGEERGGIGSGLLAGIYDKVDYVSDIKRCISFDRRDTCSVITSQLGRVCCSDTFATALCKEYNSNGLNLSLDPTGIYTDSASFLDDIPECTNISVGYYNEHTHNERQNITFLEKLCEASLKVNWESLPSARKIGIDQEILRKYNKLIADLKTTPFIIDVKIKTDENSITSIVCDLEDGNITDTYESLSLLQFLLDKHKVKQDAYFEFETIKIDLI